MSILDQECTVIRRTEQIAEDAQRELDCMWIATIAVEEVAKSINEKIADLMTARDEYIGPDKTSYKNKRMEASFDANSKQSWKYRNMR